jgi:hypothetical protein
VGRRTCSPAPEAATTLLPAALGQKCVCILSSWILVDILCARASDDARKCRPDGANYLRRHAQKQVQVDEVVGALNRQQDKAFRVLTGGTILPPPRPLPPLPPLRVFPESALSFADLLRGATHPLSAARAARKPQPLHKHPSAHLIACFSWYRTRQTVWSI